MSIKIDLTNHRDKFANNSLELTLYEKVNIIFGKNGTGKTTIADEIDEQFSDNYNVCIFKNFAGVIENERLNAVALGTKNVEIQKKIESIDEEIKELEKETMEPEDKTINNLFAKNEKAHAICKEASKKISYFYTSAARRIKEIENPQISKPAYNKNDFENDISKAALLSGPDIAKHKTIILAGKKAEVFKNDIPKIELSQHLNLTNEILKSYVKPQLVVRELENSTEKQNFARKGMEIHLREENEVCAFCGNTIDEERWQLLGNYFNDKVETLEEQIKERLSGIDLVLKDVESIKKIKADEYYDQYAEEIEIVNLKLTARRGECIGFLNDLKVALEGKKNARFTQSVALEINVPDDFTDIDELYTELVKTQNEFSGNLENERAKAKDALRYCEVKKELDAFNHDEEIRELEKLKNGHSLALNILKDKETELQNKIEERKKLIAKTVSEERVANEINRLLSSMGVTSFSLELVDDGEEGQKGQYRVKGHDGQPRPITQLSDGQKNIIAILYFLLSLKNVKRDGRPKIIVLDDPMTSNDDTMQYLMIGEIQKLYGEIKNSDYLLISTHNCHFYLNVRPYNKIDLYEKYNIIHLNSDGKLTNIKRIATDKEDFKTNYELLWKELVFLYNNDVPDLMLNPCRRICETYIKFTKSDLNGFYKDHPGARKLFNVNQHSLDDLEAEQNGKNREEIKNILLGLFKSAKAEDHFNGYWEKSETL